MGNIMQAFFIGVNSKFIHTALGIRYVTEYCRKFGIAAHMLEATVNEPVLSVLTRITEQVEACVGKSNSPVLIGLEVHIWNRNFVLELGGLLRKVLPEALLMLGGPEVMFHPETALTAAPFADFIVCGEGEEVVACFLQNLIQMEKEQKDILWGKGAERQFLMRRFSETEGTIPYGIAYRNTGGEVVAPEKPLVVEDLDRLPFPYPDLEEIVSRHKIVYYEASRGCPFHCAYCLSGISHSVRRRRLSLVLADMDRFMQAGVKLVKFVDRTYNLDESYYLPIMEYLASADTDAVFHFEIKADILSRKVIDFLKTVPRGRFQLEIGVQSTNPEVLQAVGRQDNWERLRENVSSLLDAGNMHIHMDLIAGLPLENLNSFASSFNDVYGLHPHALQLGFLKVLPGTVMDREVLRHEMVYMDQPPYEILSNRYVTYKEIRFLKILEEVFNLVYNSGRFPLTLRYLVRMFGKDNAFSFYKEFTEWYRDKGMAGLGHNGMEAAGMLYGYTAEMHPDLLFFVREILRLDVLLYLPNFKPDWLAWRSEINYEKATSFWRDEEEVRKYLPGYTFKNWRGLHKRYALEEFLCDPWTGEKKSVFILANYAEMSLTRIETSANI